MQNQTIQKLNLRCKQASKALNIKSKNLVNSFVNKNAVHRRSKSQQKQIHLGMSEWRLRFITKEEIYKSRLEKLLFDFKIKFIAALRISQS